MQQNAPTNRKARVVVLKTGTTYPDIRARFGDFDQWFLRGLSDELEITVANAEASELPGNPEDWDGIVVTGSPAMVSDRAEWSENAGRWLAKAVRREIPVLGVCYGHQLLAHALGGEAGYHPDGRETGTPPDRGAGDRDASPRRERPRVRRGPDSRGWRLCLRAGVNTTPLVEITRRGGRRHRRRQPVRVATKNASSRSSAQRLSTSTRMSTYGDRRRADSGQRPGEAHPRPAPT